MAETPQCTAVGGTLLVEVLTASVARHPRDYDLGKAAAWVRMVNDLQRPTKWYAPTGKGTSVDFDFIVEQAQYDEAKRELVDYVADLNQRYPEVGIQIGPEQEAGGAMNGERQDED